MVVYLKKVCDSFVLDILLYYEKVYTSNEITAQTELKI